MGVNCLFNYDGVNYRLVINTKNNKDNITFDELRKHLRDHPKLKEIDFFDTEKYVVEIFDKGFDDYLKLPRVSSIPDYSKLRARLRPKPTTAIGKKDEETKKRPLSMYAEINLEEERAQKILRGSPPPSSNQPRVQIQSPPSSSFRRSQPTTSESHRSENSSRSHTSSRSNAAMPKPSAAQTTPKTSVPSTKPQAVTKPIPASSKASVTSKTPTSKPVSTSNPSNLPSTSVISTHNMSSQPNTPRGSQGNGLKNIPPGMDSDSFLLSKSVAKYNDEFTDIMMFDDIWETNNVWSFVFREISGLDMKNIKNIEGTRNAFKALVDKYISLLQNPSLSEKDAKENWPLFELFHTQINLKPFYGRIQTLKDTFNARVDANSSINRPTRPSNSGDSQSNSNAAPTSEPAPKPQRTPVNPPPEDFIRLSTDEDRTDYQMQDNEDPEIEEVLLDVDPTPTPTPTQKSKAEPVDPPSCVITSDDFRLLLAVEDHNKEFYDEIIPEYSVWREVTDQINLYKPFEPSLVMKYKTRFYELLKEFMRIENSSMPVAEKAQWKLYSSFINIDTTPFLSKLT